MQTLAMFWKELTGGQLILFVFVASVFCFIACSMLWKALRAIDRALTDNMSEDGWRRFFIACAVVGVVLFIIWIFN